MEMGEKREMAIKSEIINIFGVKNGHKEQKKAHIWGRKCEKRQVNTKLGAKMDFEGMTSTYFGPQNVEEWQYLGQKWA